VYVAYTPRRKYSYDPDDYVVFTGNLVNVNNLFAAIGIVKDNVQEYGANSTINYLALRFSGLSFESNGFPVYSVRPDDFLLIEITIPSSDWMDQHNLLNFTPYFYDFVDEDGNKSTAFASVDSTVSFFDGLQPGSVHKICCTSSNNIAASFADEGYRICRIPIEFIGQATFLPLFRVGIMGQVMGNLPQGMMQATYYQAVSAERADGASYSDSMQIIQTFARPLEPMSDAATRAIHTSYNETIKQLSSSGYEVFHTFNFMAHVAHVKYAFQSFYDAISVRPVVGLLGNNTGENYFMSDDIDITQYSPSDTLYVLSVNQALSRCALSSNVQVYDRHNNSLVPGGTFETSPPLPPMSAAEYPASSARSVHSYPTMMISKYPLRDLLTAGLRKIAITERNAYNPVNYHYTSTLYVDTACYFVGEDLPVDLIDSLRTSCGCRVRPCSEPVLPASPASPASVGGGLEAEAEAEAEVDVDIEIGASE